MDYRERWPELGYENWKDTLQTLHRWTQIVGKIRLSKSPWINHGWGSTLYVTDRGLTTSVIHDRSESFTIEFDFVAHQLWFSRSDGTKAAFHLTSEPVAAFHDKCMSMLRRLGVRARISDLPNELPDALAFSLDRVHATYDPRYANRCWRILLATDRVMKRFRSRFIGKVSPVHFFWGSFDLAVTRFSGRLAPEHPGGVPHLPDLIAREAYSHEVSSCGFWPGSELAPFPAFYSYAYPKPEGFESAKILPPEARYDDKLREFLLPYEAVRSAPNPDAMLLDFFQSTYDAAADLAEWDRAALEHGKYIDEIRRQREAGARAA